MSDESNNQLDPRTALDQAQRVGNTVRRKGRWHGWVWLTLAVITPMFLIGAYAESVPGDVQFWLAVAFGVVAGTLWIWETRRGLWGREAAAADRPFTRVYMVFVAAVALVAIVFDPTGTPAWYVAIAVLPSVPCLMAAWRILRA